MVKRRSACISPGMNMSRSRWNTTSQQSLQRIPPHIIYLDPITHWTSTPSTPCVPPTHGWMMRLWTCISTSWHRRCVGFMENLMLFPCHPNLHTTFSTSPRMSKRETWFRTSSQLDSSGAWPSHFFSPCTSWKNSIGFWCGLTWISKGFWFSTHIPKSNLTMRHWPMFEYPGILPKLNTDIVIEHILVVGRFI